MKMNIKIYTKPDCKWCVAAKEFLTTQRTSFCEILIVNSQEEAIKVCESGTPAATTREVVKERFPEAKTVPIVVIDGKYIGGYMELVEYFTSNGMMLA